MKDAPHPRLCLPSSRPRHAPLLVFDGAMIVVGIVIGAGIFRTPSMVAGVTGSVEWMLTAWVLGSVLAAHRRAVPQNWQARFPMRAATTTFRRALDATSASSAWARVASDRPARSLLAFVSAIT